jgi:hypothetical protein
MIRVTLITSAEHKRFNCLFSLSLPKSYFTDEECLISNVSLEVFSRNKLDRAVSIS